MGNKILWKYFPQYIFSLLYLTAGFKLHIHLLNVVVRFIVFLNSANLICRGTDISKYFRESPGLQDNKSRLYLNVLKQNMYVWKAKCIGSKTISSLWIRKSQKFLKD